MNTKITDERLKALQELCGHSTAMLTYEVIEMATELLSLRSQKKELIEAGNEMYEYNEYSRDKWRALLKEME